jgi:hypothetical protein
LRLNRTLFCSIWQNKANFQVHIDSLAAYTCALWLHYRFLAEGGHGWELVRGKKNEAFSEGYRERQIEERKRQPVLEKGCYTDSFRW